MKKKNKSNYLSLPPKREKPEIIRNEYTEVDNLINLNDYVLNEKGLIGIIKNKYHNMAIVQLLTSKDILLQIQINNCYGLFKNNQIDNIDTHCLIKQGDEVYTSNLGYTDTLILIGHIKTIIDNQNELSNSYLISLVNNEILSRDVVILRSK